MKKVTAYLIKSILAGVMIAIGGTVFLSTDNKVIGAFLFAIGLFIIVTKGLNLYTGKVGYIFDNGREYLLEVAVTVVGNFIGTFCFGFLLRFTRIYEPLHEKAQGMVATKLGDSPLSIFLLAVFCGVLMYLAVNGYKLLGDKLGGYLGVFLGVMVFILCGFEHSIANMFYITAAWAWSLKALGYLLLMLLGNGVGCVLFPLCEKGLKQCQ